MTTTPCNPPTMVRSYRYFDLVMVAFVVVYLCSNLIGPAKVALKVMVEVVMLPVTLRIVRALRKAEAEDYDDHNTNFTPFSLKT